MTTSALPTNIAPALLLISAAGVLCFGIYPHCFTKLAAATVLEEGRPVPADAVYSNGSSDSVLVAIDSQHGGGYAEYTVDRVGETAGLLDKKAVVGELRGVIIVVRDPTRVATLVESEIYAPHDIGHDPFEFRFTDLSGRRIDVRIQSGIGKHKWLRILGTPIGVALFVIMLFAPLLLIGNGWWSLAGKSDEMPKRERGLFRGLMALATFDWLVLVIAMRGYDASVTGPFSNPIVMAGIAIPIVAGLFSIFGTRSNRLLVLYPSMCLILVWCLVILNPF